MVIAVESVDNEISIQHYQQCLNETIGDSSTNEILKLEHVFGFIQKNIKNIGESLNMSDILPVLHHSIRLELKTDRQIQMGEHICSLFDLADLPIHKQNSIQVLYQILQTLSPEDTQRFKVGDEIFLKCIQLLQHSNTTSLLRANILACIQLYIRKFKATHILCVLWQNGIETTIITGNIAVEDSATLQTLITLFDDFAEIDHVTNFKQIMQTTSLLEKLLKSGEHDKRKSAYFLLKKSYHFMFGTDRFWTTCINIFENLEENQSHLILPSLELLKSLNAISSQELKWLNILYYKILEHNNILVRRWVLEYFLEHKSINTLTADILFQLLQAFNDTILYNVERYMLPEQHIKTFLGCCNKPNFFKQFCTISWKAVPLHYWLTQLLHTWEFVALQDLSNDIPINVASAEEILLTLAAKIRALQNVELRREIIELYGKLFSIPISNMEFLSYVDLVKALYNVSDPFGNVKLLSEKLNDFPLESMEANRNYVFDQRFYDIITNQIIIPCNNFQELFGNLLYEKLKGIESKWQGYLRFIVVFDLYQCSKKQEFCENYYNLDMESLYKISSFHDLYAFLCAKFENTSEYKIFIRRKAMDFYVCKSKLFKHFDDLKKCDIKIDEILNAGSSMTLLKLTSLLAYHKKLVENSIIQNFIDSLRYHLKNNCICFKVCSNLLQYFKNAFQPEQCALWTKTLLEMDLENLAITGAVFLKEKIEFKSEKFLIKGALSGDAKTGDVFNIRIEEAYTRKFTLRWVKCYHVRRDYVKQMAKVETDTSKQTILLSVCEIAKKQYLKKPRYFAHSKDHRLLTRITYVIWNLIETSIEFPTRNVLFLKLWSLLMEHNNQPNVAVIYECSIVRLVDFTTLFEKIELLQMENKRASSQEVSMIMLLYRFFEINLNCTSLTNLCKVLTFLWPFTMGSSFQSRLYAQLVMVALIDKLEEHRKTCVQEHIPTLEIQTYIQLKTAIEQIIGKKQIITFLKDFRFTPISKQDFYNDIMYLTKAPYDEYDKSSKHFNNEHKLPTKKLIEAAKGEIEKDEQKINNVNNFPISSDVQRKLNPVADFMPQANLITYPEYKEHEIYIIASLIDKVPNLGGIARTCEVLGLRNLVMDSKAHITKTDFKNLSMTAEKNLNIIEVKPVNLQEFFIQKKNQGFEIVGAEQTAKSLSFIDFIFPKRCVLLLGHEKEGIPSNLLGFLDYAVEIPQFGMVRSLNVHVTGALFMWEYCKQHIVKKKS